MSETPAIYTTRADHHPHGPSAIGNPCKAAWKLSQHAPALPPSTDADEGTLMHAAVASRGATDLAKLDSEQLAAVDRCIAQADQWADSLGCDKPLAEQTLSLYAAGGELVNFGTLDFIALSPNERHAILADWKMGRLASPLVADQLANYVAMAFQRWPELQTIEAHAWFPRVPALNQCWTYTRDDLPGLVERIKARITVRVSPERWEFETGDHCRYCRAALICGARRREIGAVAFCDSGLVEGLAPEQVANFLPVLKRVEKISDAIKARAKALAGSGQLPGYRLAEVRGRRELQGTTQDAAAELHSANWTADELWAAAKFDLGSLEEVARKKPLPPGETRKPEEYHLSSIARLIGRGLGYTKLVEEKQ